MVMTVCFVCRALKDIGECRDRFIDVGGSRIEYAAVCLDCMENFCIHIDDTAVRVSFDASGACLNINKEGL